MLEESPTKNLKSLTELPNAPRLLEQGEVALLLEAMPDHQKALVACVVYAGLRRAELFHLQLEGCGSLEGRAQRGVQRDASDQGQAVAAHTNQ